MYSSISAITCRPFLKWAGGKRQLLPYLTRNAPKLYNRYFEPFIGGGALFFHLKPKNAYISDINPDLINTYKVIRDDADELVAALKVHKNTERYFYKIRNVDRNGKYKRWSCVEKAARLIYLNKTCFNGLYRVNSEGFFNAPYGFYKNPKIIDITNLRECSKVLKRVTVGCHSFLEIEKKIKREDFVYFDPPYVPLTNTSNFRSYSKESFDDNMQFELKELCDRLDKKSVRFMLSNSYTSLVKDLYSKKYRVKVVKANRTINCNGTKRGKINELIVTNY